LPFPLRRVDFPVDFEAFFLGGMRAPFVFRVPGVEARVHYPNLTRANAIGGRSASAVAVVPPREYLPRSTGTTTCMSSTLPNDDVTQTDAEGGEFTDDTANTRAEPPAPDEALEGDERMYTGEPVDDGDDVRRPQQMNVGVDNMDGGGEWPDPKG
jgi:hypothetical protein